MWFFMSALSAIFSALSALGQKKVLKDLDAFNFCFILSFFNIILSIPFFFSSPFELLTFFKLFLLITKSLLNAIGFFFVMQGLKNLDISRSLPLLALTPLFVMIGGFFFLGEFLNFKESFSVLLICVGAFILEFRESKIELTHFKGHLPLILAVFFMSLNTLMDRYIVGPLKIHPHTSLSITQITFFIFFLCLLPFKKVSFKNLFFETKKFFSYFLFIALFTIAYRYTNIIALSLAPAALVISIKRSSVFFASLVGGKIFHEQRQLKRAIGAIFIVFGTILLFKHG